ncbi:MAG: hypothetical protein FE78DRAFT_65962 [Acidomyces sp. 'richmondensis']|nr:MAG: hypothetical protein FE78DRAFT_65962 [Acidomyces sp. 'richmondensis']
MADLGLARRDYVSFPLANGRYWDDVNQQEKTQAENASRARARNNSSDDIQHSEILRKWNAREMFSKDDLNDQLHNRYDGQGHRTQLAESLRRRHYDAHSEALEAHVGEERAIYIRERPGKWKSYAAAPGSAPVKQHQSATRSSTTVSAACTPHCSQGNETISYKAEYWAANPGSKCDEYHQKHPECRKHLRNAQKRLIKKAFVFATKPEHPDTLSYYSQHPIQKWMFEKALVAIDLIENKTEADIEAYYASHPNEQDFRGCAKVNFKPKHSGNTFTEVPAELPPAPVGSLFPSPLPSTQIMLSKQTSLTGSINFSFIDFLGNLTLQVKQVVAIPVKYDVQLEALEAGFDIRDVIGNFHILAETMNKLQNSRPCEVASIPGWRMADDGVWEET